MDTPDNKTTTQPDPQKLYFPPWGELKKQWEMEVTRDRINHQTLYGILCSGFVARVDSFDEAAERVCFYLDAADGYRYGLTPRGTVEISSVDVFSPGFLAQRKARRAWKELCGHFFENRNKKMEGLPTTPSWATLVRTPPVFKKVLWFFDPDRPLHKSNFPPSPPSDQQDRIAREFLLKAALLAWDTSPGSIEQDMFELFRNSRPKLVEILHRLEALDFLLDSAREVDESSIRKLDVLAVTTSPGNPKPKDAREAFYIWGNVAGRYAILLRFREEERKRQAAEKAQQAISDTLPCHECPGTMYRKGGMYKCSQCGATSGDQ
ncbi:MAG: hypothetical protein V1696_02300 [Candidatus Jorgensenbacteria bacterium]